MTKIQFSVELRNFDNEAFSKLRKLDEERASLISRVISDFKKSDRLKAAKDIAAPDTYGAKDPSVTFDGKFFNVTIACVASEEPVTKKSTYPPSLNMHESTLNTLLQGKLLSDSEKRKLINAATGGIIEAEAAKEGDAK